MDILHKGEKIHFLEETEKWEWNDISYPALKTAKAAIDRFQKEKFDRTPAFYKSHYREEYVKVEITSRAQRNYFWIVNEKGKREKVYSDGGLVPQTGKNVKLVAELNDLTKQISALMKKQSSLENKLDTLSEYIAKRETSTPTDG